MEEQLLDMLGCLIPSSTGVVRYKVSAVVPGECVVLTAPTRSHLSVLKWADVELVYRNAPASGLRTVDVDIILENPQFRHSASLCALVLALQDPNRVHRS